MNNDILPTDDELNQIDENSKQIYAEESRNAENGRKMINIILICIIGAVIAMIASVLTP